MAAPQLVQVGSKTQCQAGDYDTVSYACDNFNDIFLLVEETSTNNIKNLNELFVTIKAGQQQIVGRTPLSLLGAINQYQEGTNITQALTGTSTKGHAKFKIACGTWYLDKGEELYVSFTNASSADNFEISVFANVNSPEPPSPLNYSYNVDTSFMIPACETLFLHNSHASEDMHQNDGTVTLQYGSETVVIPINGSNVVLNSETVGDVDIPDLGLAHDGVAARDMQVNILSASGHTVTTLGINKVVSTNKQVMKARRFIPSKLRSLSRKEKVLMAQGH